jgi:hypothetical protein
VVAKRFFDKNQDGVPLKFKKMPSAPTLEQSIPVD